MISMWCRLKIFTICFLCRYHYIDITYMPRTLFLKIDFPPVLDMTCSLVFSRALWYIDTPTSTWLTNLLHTNSTRDTQLQKSTTHRSMHKSVATHKTMCTHKWSRMLCHLNVIIIDYAREYVKTWTWPWRAALCSRVSSFTQNAGTRVLEYL